MSDVILMSHTKFYLLEFPFQADRRADQMDLESMQQLWIFLSRVWSEMMHGLLKTVRKYHLDITLSSRHCYVIVLALLRNHYATVMLSLRHCYVSIPGSLKTSSFTSQLVPALISRSISSIFSFSFWMCLINASHVT